MMADIHPMHTWFCEQTRQNVRRTWNYETMRLWAELLAQHSEADVFAVLKYLVAEIEVKRRNQGSLRLRNFLQPDEFADNLWMAGKDRLRAPKPPPGLAPRQLGDVAVLIEEAPPPPPPTDDMRRQVSAGLSGLAEAVRKSTFAI